MELGRTASGAEKRRESNDTVTFQLEHSVRNGLIKVVSGCVFGGRGREERHSACRAPAELAGLGRPIMAYVNVADESEAEYVDRVEVHVGAQRDEHGVWRDGDGCVVEDFGLPETLMLWAEARRLFLVIADPFEDHTGLQLCLDALQLYAED